MIERPAEYLDFEAPWYYREVNNNLAFNQKLYTVSGSFNFQTINESGAIIFNKELMTDIGEEAPYQTVLDGKWTYDHMMTIAEKAIEDTNGDGKMDASDRFGILSGGDEAFNFLAYGMGYRITSYQNHRPTMVGATEQVVDIMDAMTKLMDNTSVMFRMRITGEDNVMFPSGQGLFYVMNLAVVVQDVMREAPDFGILPIPKMNEEQDIYYSKCFADASAFPLILKDREMSQIVLEGLNSITWQEVIPEYYNVVLQRKLTRDEESSAMIDLIQEGAICEFGMAFQEIISPALYWFQSYILPGSFATWWGGNENAVNTNLETLLEQLTTLDPEG